jgi:hypothetical protein
MHWTPYYLATLSLGDWHPKACVPHDDGGNRVNDSRYKESPWKVGGSAGPLAVTPAGATAEIDTKAVD